MIKIKIKNDLSQYIDFTKRLAIWSFSIGTFFFLLFYFTESLTVILIGQFYIVIAGVINFGVFLFLLLEYIKQKTQKIIFLKAMSILLINIPVVLIYYTIVMNTIFRNISS